MSFENLKNTMEILLDEYKTPSVNCIVCKDGKEVFRFFKGYKDIETKEEIKGDELYYIFSMSKMLTCTCALQLFEKGAYKMDDYLYDYLPEFKNMKIREEPFDAQRAINVATGKVSWEEVSKKESDDYAKNPITIKDLFTMSAGLNYDFNTPAIKKLKEEGKETTRELVGALSETVLSFEPGTGYSYSLCHDVLGALIEVWSGKSFGEYLKENVTDVLGMKNTFFGNHVTEEQKKDFVSMYMFDKEGNPEKKPLECEFIIGKNYESGGAGLVSTADDYSIFLDAIANGGMGRNGKRILNAPTVELMRTNHLPGKVRDYFDFIRKGYGYGLGVRTHMYPEMSGSLSPVGEFGWDGAAGCFAIADTKNNLSLTYFQQCRNWNMGIQGLIRNALYKDLENSLK